MEVFEGQGGKNRSLLLSLYVHHLQTAGNVLADWGYSICISRVNSKRVYEALFITSSVNLPALYVCLQFSLEDQSRDLSSLLLLWRCCILALLREVILHSSTFHFTTHFMALTSFWAWKQQGLEAKSVDFAFWFWYPNILVGGTLFP